MAMKDFHSLVLHLFFRSPFVVGLSKALFIAVIKKYVK